MRASHRLMCLCFGALAGVAGAACSGPPPPARDARDARPMFKLDERYSAAYPTLGPNYEEAEKACRDAADRIVDDARDRRDSANTVNVVLVSAAGLLSLATVAYVATTDVPQQRPDGTYSGTPPNPLVVGALGAGAAGTTVPVIIDLPRAGDDEAVLRSRLALLSDRRQVVLNAYRDLKDASRDVERATADHERLDGDLKRLPPEPRPAVVVPKPGASDEVRRRHRGLDTVSIQPAPSDERRRVEARLEAAKLALDAANQRERAAVDALEDALLQFEKVCK